MESALDSLLNRAEKRHEPSVANPAPPADLSPIDQLRELFAQRIVATVRRMHDRYAERGVRINMDASNFLAGGREFVVEIGYGEHRLCLQGTVMPDAIAFHEMHYADALSGTVSGGPSLRTRNLDEQVFADFVYEHVIQLVKSANRHS